MPWMPNAKDMKRNPGSTREGCGDILGEDDGCQKAGKPKKLDVFHVGWVWNVSYGWVGSTRSTPNAGLNAPPTWHDLPLPMCQHSAGWSGRSNGYIGPCFFKLANMSLGCRRDQRLPCRQLLTYHIPTLGKGIIIDSKAVLGKGYVL